MIDFQRFTLDNGLRVLVHTDESTPLVTVCMTYFVGTRDEDWTRTGFAHLFEHLMFGGSKNAPNFDDFIQNAGGENNAFTNQDMTVYYDMVPKQNLEVALWLESDRMANLMLNKKALATQRKVVVEEFKETCLNEPYGDIWHHIGELVYKVHPYQIPTIGKTFEHIEQASLEDVKAFFQRFYRPNNAVLTLCGNVTIGEAKDLVIKWFNDIPKGETIARKYPQEPLPTQAQTLHIEADVPLNSIYMVFPAAARDTEAFYIEDVLSDILAEGEAARLYKNLLKDKQLFAEIDAYTTGTIDAGLLVVEGRLSETTSFEQAEKAIWEELQKLQQEELSLQEWEKLQNRVEHNLALSEISATNKAISLGFYELLGKPEDINKEAEHYRNVSPKKLQIQAQSLFQPNRCATIYYKSKQKSD